MKTYNIDVRFKVKTTDEDRALDLIEELLNVDKPSIAGRNEDIKQTHIKVGKTA